MSIKAEKIPPARTLLGVLDAQARETVGQARRVVKPIVTAQTPRHSGATAKALQPRVSRTKTGAALNVRAPRGRRHPSGATIAQVVRWVNRGTGLFREGAGAKAPIQPKGARARRRGATLSVYGRPYRSVKGQKPNKFMDRIERQGTPKVRRAFEQGARRAARAVERQVG